MSAAGEVPADQAADLFIHYFRTLGGVERSDWDPDYSAEIRNAVDHLMNAARDIAREEIETLGTRLRQAQEEHDSDIRRLWDHISRMPGGV